MRFKTMTMMLMVLMLCFSSYALANEPTMVAAADDATELALLLEIIEEETEIATKTKLNADYVPGIVTVLKGSDLEALGARTVWEALDYVPGVETSINNRGRPSVIIRGIGYELFGGHYKLLVNSSPVNLTGTGSNDPILMIPIEQVERIEVIRGPGTAVYGEFAYSGVVNIVLKKDGGSMHASGGSFGTYGAGVYKSLYDAKKDLRLTVNLAGWLSDGAENDSGPDSVVGFFGQPGISFSPGKTNEDEEVKSINIALDHKKSHIDFYAIERDHGQYFGIGALQPSSSRNTMEEEYWALNLSQGLGLTPELEVAVNLHMSEGTELVDEHMIQPPGFVYPLPPLPGPPPPPVIATDGHWRRSYVKERRLEGALEFRWSGWKNHEWLIRPSIASIEVLDSWGEENVFLSPPPPTPLPAMTRLPEVGDGLADKGTDRTIRSLMVQDQFSVTDSFFLTGTARYDDFDDVGGAFNGRLAAVWRVGEPHIIKLQYASAYRPPNFLELDMNGELEPQTMDTYEIGYIYRMAGFVGRATAFYSELDDMIVQTGLGPRSRTTNNGKGHLAGAELELERQLFSDWKVVGNLSYVDAYDDVNDDEIGGGASWLGNLVVKGEVINDLLLALRYRHVGERGREHLDDRGALEGYDTVDLTLSRYNLLVKGLTVRAGAKNIFNEGVKAPSYPDTYEKDLPRTGRSWWLLVSKAI